MPGNHLARQETDSLRPALLDVPSVISSFSLGDGYALLYTMMMAGHMA
jgi:hypothetical protein